MTAYTNPVEEQKWRVSDYSDTVGSQVTGWDYGLDLTLPADSTTGTVNAGRAVLRGISYAVTTGTTETIQVPLALGTYYASFKLGFTSAPHIRSRVLALPSGGSKSP